MTLKELRERKNTLIAELEKINSDAEERAQSGGSMELTQEEATAYGEKSKELDAVCAAIKRKEALREAGFDGGDGKEGDEGNEGNAGENEDDDDDDESDDEAQAEERAFKEYIVAKVNGFDTRAETKMTKSANGAIIPKTIAKKIIEKLENICDVYQRATKFHFKGEVSFPVIDDTSDDVIVNYAEEFAGLTSHVSSFTSVTLKGYLFASLCLISRSLINNSDIDVVGIIVTRMAYAYKKFLEGECLIGTENKMTGILSTANTLSAASQAAVTADELIDLQAKIIDPLQKDCVFYMHPNTRTAIRKLKDSQGRYLLNNDVTTGFKDMLLGKPVIVSDKMPQLGKGNKAVFYGDPSGLYVNITEEMSLQVLQEKYAEHHAIGFNLWSEMDSKIAEPQKLAVLVCASA